MDYLGIFGQAVRDKRLEKRACPTYEMSMPDFTVRRRKEHDTADSFQQSAFGKSKMKADS